MMRGGGGGRVARIRMDGTYTYEHGGCLSIREA